MSPEWMDNAMVELNFNIDAQELFSVTSSLLQVYVEGNMEVQLSEATPTYAGSVAILSDDARIVLIRRYHAPNTTDTQIKENLFLKVVKKAVGFLSLFLLAYVPIEPFNCIYEVEEHFHLTNLQAGSAIRFLCKLDPSSRCTKFKSQPDRCMITSTQKNYIISKEEINSHYKEQKKFIKLFGFGSSILLSLLMVLSLMGSNTITALFLGIIIALIVGCSLFSLMNLRKEYLKLLTGYVDG